MISGTQARRIEQQSARLRARRSVQTRSLSAHSVRGGLDTGFIRRGRAELGNGLVDGRREGNDSSFKIVNSSHYKYSYNYD
jgi:hypothetical protein